MVLQQSRHVDARRAGGEAELRQPHVQPLAREHRDVGPENRIVGCEGRVRGIVGHLGAVRPVVRIAPGNRHKSRSHKQKQSQGQGEYGRHLVRTPVLVDAAHPSDEQREPQQDRRDAPVGRLPVERCREREREELGTEREREPQQASRHGPTRQAQQTRQTDRREKEGREHDHDPADRDCVGHRNQQCESQKGNDEGRGDRRRRGQRPTRSWTRFAGHAVAPSVWQLTSRSLIFARSGAPSRIQAGLRERRHARAQRRF